MVYETWNRDRGGPAGSYAYQQVSGGLAGNRFCRWVMASGAPSLAAYPPAGGAVHAVTMAGDNSVHAWLAQQGRVAGVELGEAVTAGALLATDSLGRAVNASGGNQVARALEAGAAGAVVYFAFER